MNFFLVLSFLLLFNLFTSGVFPYSYLVFLCVFLNSLVNSTRGVYITNFYHCIYTNVAVKLVGLFRKTVNFYCFYCYCVVLNNIIIQLYDRTYLFQCIRNASSMTCYGQGCHRRIEPGEGITLLGCGHSCCM